MQETPPSTSEIISSLRGAFYWSIFFSFCTNVLMLALPLYLLQVFDRVLTSRSVDTLWVLTGIVVVALLAYGCLESVRRLLLSRCGALMESHLLEPVLSAAIENRFEQRTSSAATAGDLGTLRSYLGGQALLPFLDAPWSLIFVAVVFGLHPVLGWIALGAAVGLGLLALINERATRDPLQRSRDRSMRVSAQLFQLGQCSESARAMGITSAVIARVQTGTNQALHHWETGTRRQHQLSALSKVLRQLVQVTVLATGAWLAVNAVISPGAMIAASILVTRALAPFEQLIGSWGQSLTAFAAWQRLKTTPSSSATDTPTRMPAPAGRLVANSLTYVYPNQSNPTFTGVSLALEPGESLGLIGPTGSGKSTLARCLLGIYSPRLGDVRLDGVSLSDWDVDDRGQYLGYLPQELDLLPGTVAENISRFQKVEDERVIAAARLAGAHEMILNLPDAYETQTGQGGVMLSGGQRQRIALARALYGQVRLLVLDEPNANQDRAGEEALLEALREVKARGLSSIVIAHRPAIIKYVDKILVLQEGRCTHYGPRDEVLAALNSASLTPDSNKTPSSPQASSNTKLQPAMAS